MNRVEDPKHIHLDTALPGQGVGPCERPERGNTGVGPHHINAAVAQQGARHHGLAIGWPADIRKYREQIAAECCGGGRQGLRVAVDQHRDRSAPL